MTDIPFSVKVMHSLGLVKVTKKQEPEPAIMKNHHSLFDGLRDAGAMPKTNINRPIPEKQKGVFTFKASYLLAAIPLFLMILIPITMLIPHQNNQDPFGSGPAPSIDLTPVNDHYTDAQIIAKYPALTDLDRALVSGELKLDQVSDNMRGMIKQQKLGEFHD